MIDLSVYIEGKRTVVFEDSDFGAGSARTVHNGSVVQCVADNQTAFAH